ncbi:MAG: hypothetical protein ACI4TG_01205 [Ruminococcus sp.]
MKNKRFSTLGYIMNFLNVQTTAMAKALHVDPSLISKWKSGTRQLTEQSIYFEDVIHYLIESSYSDDFGTLKSALSDLFPHEQFSDNAQIEKHLRYALSGEIPENPTSLSQVMFGNVKTIPVMIFDQMEGRQEAVNKLFDYAESITEPGELTFIDTDAFRWLWEDSDFSQLFTQRLLKLLKRGFHATFAIRNASSKENFRKFFDSCSPIIFHKNVKWYYVQYYDVPIIGFSLLLINHAVSAIGMFTQGTNMTTMIFKDSSVILQHESFVKNFIQNCIPLFEEFNPFDMPKIIEDTPKFRRKSSFFAFLPVPAFIAVDTELLKEILLSNEMDNQSDMFQNVLKLNHFFKMLSGVHCPEIASKQETILIFQIEKMIQRVRKKSFVSNSLTYSCKKEIIIQPKQHAAELRSLADALRSNSNLQIVLASERDAGPLPSMNCWCMQDSYMLQMHEKGFRFCEESTVVSVASNALECCVHKVPPERKERQSVMRFLIELAEELENN